MNTRNMRAGGARKLVEILSKGLCIGMLTASVTVHMAAAAGDAVQQRLALASAATPSDIEAHAAAVRGPKRANFGATFERQRASREARHVADWVVDSGDNRGMPFVIVDKKDAMVFVFDAHGLLRGAAPALLGLARGDESVPGIGGREMASIRPEERTTPAGRFVASLDRNMRGEEILWVDYDAAISMHRVVTSKPEERRAQRLATATPLDNRISYGCINVPVAFYDKVLHPIFTGTYGVVYVLPETRTAREVFVSYDVEERGG